MKIRTLLVLMLLLGSAGCVTGYTLVTPGVVSVGDMQVRAGSGWNLVPAHMAPMSRKDSQLWTQDGLLLDRVVIIPGVADGEALLRTSDTDAALPVFRKDMLPNDLEELVEATLVKYIGEGNVAVDTSNLRPQLFGSDRGIRFDVVATVSDSPEYHGTVGGLVINDKLYMIIYLAVDPYYYDKHHGAAQSIMDSATVVKATAAAN